MAYDQKCYDLAEYFMSEEETESETQHKLLCDALATAIQQTVETFLDSQKVADEPTEPPNPSSPPAAA